MNRLFVPTLGPADWQRLLANPEKQWRRGKSAWESAVAWEVARSSVSGIPPRIGDLLKAEATFAEAKLLVGIPEHKVALDGGHQASQTDLWALLSTSSGLVSMAVEAKAGESFDAYVKDWIVGTSSKSGKPARLAQLCSMLEITEHDAHACRYQLMHRSAAAILEAIRFRASNAVLLVHAFGDNNQSSFDDYSAWASKLGVTARPDRLQNVGQRGGVNFWIGWVNARPMSSEDACKALGV